jgi:ribosomal protein S12 methylthiotransferase
MVELKKAGECGGVIVTGCLAERMGPQLISEIPLIDRAVGVFGRDEIASVADQFMHGAFEQRTLFRPASVKLTDDTARLRITPAHYAYLKISEGCDRTCTFCAIPKMRGKHVSKPIEKIIAEAEELVADGVRELNIVSQETTYYGKDLYGEVRLTELLRQLDQVPGLEWIRILYAYPEYVSDDLIQTAAAAKHIVPYLDIPLQHISDPVLKRMQRRVTRAKTEDTLNRLRKQWANLAIRTTFIVGFPGETDEQFDELCKFVADQDFERCGVFTYSFEEGTPATRLDGHLDEKIKEKRRDKLMKVQQKVAFKLTTQKVGTEVDVIIDAEPSKKGEPWIARSTADAPEIDTNVFVMPRKVGRKLEPLAVGKFVKVRIDATDGYDLVATAISEAW